MFKAVTIAVLSAAVVSLSTSRILAQGPSPNDFTGTYQLVTTSLKDAPQGATLDIGRLRVDDNNYTITGTYALTDAKGNVTQYALTGAMGKGGKNDGTWFGGIYGVGPNSVRTLTFYTQNFKTIYVTEIGVGYADVGTAKQFSNRPAVWRFEKQESSTLPKKK